MSSKLWAIARYTLLEYLRGRVVRGVLLLLLVTSILGWLLASAALTEGDALRASLGGALLRIALVFLLAVTVIVSQVREASDRTRDWLLAFPLPRTIWLAGRLLGHGIAAIVLAAAAGASLALFGGLEPAALWTCGLALELLICAVMAVFLSLTVPHASAAFLAFAGWYVLARSMPALQLIAANPTLADSTAGPWLIQHTLNGIGLLLPRLDLFASGLWLEGGGHWSQLAVPLAQTLSYCGLIAAASVIDLQRSEW